MSNSTEIRIKRLKPGATIAIFGASGFLGRHIVQNLAARGYRIRAAVRRPNEAMFLRPMGAVGQVEPFQANVRDDASVEAAIRGADAVINLVGILSESGKQTFQSVQSEGAVRVARAAKAAGISVFVQMSALGADAESGSDYARTKAEGEAAVRETLPEAVILRPSIVFGPQDGFFNRFAAMTLVSPALPLIGGGKTKFQPVYVKDVAEAVARVLERPDTAGKTYELGGPDTRSFRELMELTLREIGRKRVLLPLPFALASFIGWFTQFLPGAPLTVDQVRLLRHDNVVSEEARNEGRTLEGLGIKPVMAEAILETYLFRFHRQGQYAQYKTS
ncbi:NADH dehydrogenase [Parvibaculum indicum]|uniref:complex I NDUFA9 subunit family protein n=1 Tax=Parvibaculum indicum TaxID=562969 RepID=UPI0014233FB4|nr:complex I NDUFA9 subunit family protein [Parvibaculum indicum]NIJ40732.1 NADH dehydrogenase [Parvibaculum indicum]